MGSMTTKCPDGAGASDLSGEERDVHLKSLRSHGRVIEADSEEVALPPGVTHVLVKQPGKAKSRLVEKRKSFF